MIGETFEPGKTIYLQEKCWIVNKNEQLTVQMADSRMKAIEKANHISHYSSKRRQKGQSQQELV
jgi:hypothetical protein